MRGICAIMAIACALAPRARAQQVLIPGTDAASGRWRTVTGKPRDAATADTLVERLLIEHNLGAIVASVVQDGRVVWSGVAGEVARARPADTETVFRAASLGKPVFSYLVLRLVDQGVLGLDSAVADLMPRPLASYEHYRDLAADPRHRDLTPRRILSQQSGLPNWYRQGPVPLLAAPGTRFGYSGEGYALLQLAIEERTGRSVNDLARELVFGPLGMTNSSYLWEPRFDDRFAVDLDAGLGPLIRQSRERANVAGSLITTAADYARFLLAVLEGRGLSETTRAAMLAPQVAITSRSLFGPPDADTAGARALALSWTVGWGRMETAHGSALFHVGREEGCENYAVAFPQQGTALVTLSVSPLASTFSGALAEALIGGGAEPLEWLEYSRTGEAPLGGRLLLVGTLLLLAGAAAAVATRLVRSRRRT